MSLSKRLEAIANSLSKQNPEGAAALHRIIDDVRATGLEAQALSVGDPAPGFTLESTEGTQVSLDDLIAERPVILTFYRGRW